MPYNIEPDHVTCFSLVSSEEFPRHTIPHTKELPPLLQQNVSLGLTKSVAMSYKVVQIRCQEFKRATTPIRVKRRKPLSSSPSYSTTIETEEMTIANAIEEETTTTTTTRVNPTTLMVIPNEVMCALQNRLFRGHYYSFLMTHSLYGEKTSANVGYSTNPMLDVYLHNNLLIPDRTTNAAAPHWILDMVLGPFPSKEKAIACSEEWVSGTRGKESKRKKGRLLKIVNNVRLYDSSQCSKEPFRDFLQHRAPRSYLEQYEKLLERQKKIIKKI